VLEAALKKAEEDPAVPANDAQRAADEDSVVTARQSQRTAVMAGRIAPKTRASTQMPTRNDSESPRVWFRCGPVPV